MAALALLLVYAAVNVAAVTVFKLGWQAYRRAGKRAALPFAAATVGLYGATFGLVVVLLARLPVAVVVAATTGLVILLTAISAVVFLGERLSGRTALGSALVVGGVLILALA